MAKYVKYRVSQRNDIYKTQKKHYTDKVTCLCQMMGYTVCSFFKKVIQKDEHTEIVWRS